MSRDAQAALMLVVALVLMAVASVLTILGLRAVTEPPQALSVGVSLHAGAVVLLWAAMVVIGTGKKDQS